MTNLLKIKKILSLPMKIFEHKIQSSVLKMKNFGNFHKKGNFQISKFSSEIKRFSFLKYHNFYLTNKKFQKRNKRNFEFEKRKNSKSKKLKVFSFE